MADTKIKAGQFFGVVGHGTDGYFLMTNADGSMSWAEGGSAGPSVTSVSYPGDDTAADPAGGQTVVLTGTGFAASGMTVSIGGTTAPSVAHDSNTQLTITTPAKAAGDYDIVVTNTVTGASGTFVNGISYNGVPTWTTAAGSLGTFESETTISTITLQATEPDGGTITFNITNGALPSGLSLAGANIDGTTTAESSTTLYSFTIEAIDDENQSTPRNFSITVNSAEITPSENFTINTYTGNGSTQSIEGKIGTAADFNGSSSKMELTSLTTGLSGADPRSVSLWVNLSALPSSGVYTFYSSGTNSNGQAFQVSIVSTGAISVSYYNRNINTTTTLSTNTWYHIVATYKGGDVSTLSNTEIYINGSAQTLVDGGGSHTGTANISDTNHSIGYAKLDNLYFTNGKIDQVRIFDKALSSGEVTTLYGENNASSTKSTTDIFDDGSGVALYEFEEGAKDSNIADYGTGNIDSGQSAVFNGSSYIQAAADYSSSIGDITVSGWYNFSNTNDGWVGSNSGSIFSLGQSNSSQTSAGSSLNIRIAENGNTVGLNSTNNDTSITMIDSFPARNIWFHFVLTYNATTDKWNAYLNGKWQGESITRTYSFSTTALRIGGGVQNGGVFHFQGKVDKFRIYTRVLNASEIKNLTAENNVSSTNLSNLYEFSGNANDSIGTNNGTWSGTATYSTAAQFPGIISGYDGTPTNVGFVGTSFQPDLVWVKNRDSIASNFIHDSVRGIDNDHYRTIITNENYGESTFDQSWHDSYGRLSNISSNGFTINQGSVTNDTSYNNSGDDYVAWCWKAAETTTTIAANTIGNTIASDVRANQDAGFSIVSYTGNSVQGATVGHGLSSAPELIIAKSRSTSNSSWRVGATPIGWQYYMNLDGTSQAYIASSIWNSTAPTSSVFSLGNNADANGNGETKIAYCFHSVDGYQKVGSYTGNGGVKSITGLGFTPRFVLFKCSTTTGAWITLDSTRGSSVYLVPDNSEVEASTWFNFTFDADGWSVNTNNNNVNGSGQTYIYLAIA